MSPQTAQAASRQPRSVRNDEKILDAALRLAVTEGWVGLKPGRVAEIAGLSRPTVLQRHASRENVGAALWRERVADPLRQALAELIEAVNAGSQPAIAAALQLFLRPSDPIRAGVELLIVGGYVPDIASEVEVTLGEDLSAWSSARRGGRAAAAARTFALGVALGYVMEAARQPGLPMDHEVDRLARAVTRPAEPVKMPSLSATHLDAPPVFNTGDSAWDAVLTATLECIGDIGYEASTIEVICRHAGFSRTVIFRRYPSKYDMFTDACVRMFAPAVALNDAYQKQIEALSTVAVSEACYLREIMRPERRRMRTITLEQVRLSSRDPFLPESMDEALVGPDRQTPGAIEGFPADTQRAMIATEMAMQIGLALLAQYRDTLWRLPFDAVLTPWRAQF